MLYKNIFLLFLLSEFIAFGMKPDSPDPRLCDGGFDFFDAYDEHAIKKRAPECDTSQFIPLSAVDSGSVCACFYAQSVVFKKHKIDAAHEYDESSGLVFTLSLPEEKSEEGVGVQEDRLSANIYAMPGERVGGHVSDDGDTDMPLRQYMQAQGESVRGRPRKRVSPKKVVSSPASEEASLKKTIICFYAGCDYKTDKQRNLKAHCARIHAKPVLAEDTH